MPNLKKIKNYVPKVHCTYIDQRYVNFGNHGRTVLLLEVNQQIRLKKKHDKLRGRFKED